MSGVAAKLKHKLHSKTGFTLTELLLAMLILLMVTSIVAAGIPVAREAYEKVVVASNAEVLLSTSISTLRSELSMAQVENPAELSPTLKLRKTDDTEIPASDILIFYNMNRRSYSAIFKDGTTRKEMNLQRYTGYNPVLKNVPSSLTDKMGFNVEPERLVYISEKDSNNDLYVTYNSVTYSDGVVTFSGLAVRQKDKKGVDKELTSRNLSIRVLSK